MADTNERLTLPMLPLDDVVVLPGMVVPVPLSDSEARAAVEAAQAATGRGSDRRRRCCWCPGWTASTPASAPSG